MNRFFEIIISELKNRFAYRYLTFKLCRQNPNCNFYSGVYVDIHSKIDEHVVLFKNVEINNSSIGDHTFVQKNSTINFAEIGKFCSIAMRVTIGLGQHPTNYVSSHPAFYSRTQPIAKTFSKKDTFEPFKKTIINHDVWIGQNSLIMDGVTIGFGAIAAAGAVVTKDVPDYAIVAGVPAKIIGYRFDEDIRNKLVKTEWWDKPDQWLKENCSLFSDPMKLIEKLKI